MNTQNTEQNVSGETAEDVVTPTGETEKPKISEAERLYRAELAGLNRKISELEKKNQESELAKLSEVERAKEEARLAQVDRDKFIAQTIELKKTTAVLNEGLSPDFAKFISGSDDEEIRAQVATFKATVSAEADKMYKAEAARNFGGKKPEGSTAPNGNTIKRADFDAITNPAEKARVGKEFKIID